MTTAVESSVLLDVLSGTTDAARCASECLARCATEGPVIVCETVIAEVTPEVGSNEIEAFLGDWQIEFRASNVEIAVLAGSMHAVYLERGGRRGRVVPDFLIGAHALKLADRLLTRDAGFTRDYFEKLAVMAP